MAKTTIRPSILQSLIKYKALLEADGITPVKMILFGSCASGKEKIYSDIDVAVVSKNLSEDDIAEFVRLSMLSHQVDDRIEPHPFTPEEFASKLNPFAKEVKRTGIPI